MDEDSAVDAGVEMEGVRLVCIWRDLVPPVHDLFNSDGLDHCIMGGV